MRPGRILYISNPIPMKIRNDPLSAGPRYQIGLHLFGPFDMYISSAHWHPPFCVCLASDLSDILPTVKYSGAIKKKIPSKFTFQMD